MPIAGFGFTKMSAERKESKGTNIKVENNVSIKSVEEIDLGLAKQSQKSLKFSFEFKAKFEPDFGEINLAGEVLLVEDDKKAKEILKEWKKEKKVSKDILPVILNAVLHKCNIQAILLSREVNLPSPIPLPKVNYQ